MQRSFGVGESSDASLRTPHSCSHLSLELPENRKDILRGTSRATLLHRGSLFFKRGDIPGKKYQNLVYLSGEVEELAEFVSHSWHSARWQKFICLTLYYNAVPAMICSFLSSFASMIIFASGGLPPQGSGKNVITQLKYEWGTWCVRIFGPVVFLLVLLKWQCIRDFLGVPQKLVFFDRVCIDQIDQERKRQGILSLGAFLARSRRMVILWSPEYLSRLWCVFEVAVLNHLTENLSTPLSLSFIPLPLAPAVAGSCIGAYSIAFVGELLLLLHNPEISKFDDGQMNAIWHGLGIFSVIFMMIWGVINRRLFQAYLIERRQVSNQLEGFCIEQAHCFLEEDRKLVNHSIGLMFGGGNEEVGKRKFEAAVRGSFKERTSAAISGHLPYPILLFMCWPIAWYEMDFLCAYIRSDFPVDVIIFEGLIGASFVLLFCPVCNLIMLGLANWMPSRGALFVDLCVSLMWYLFIAINWLVGAFASSKWYLTFLVVLWWVLLFWGCHQYSRREKSSEKLVASDINTHTQHTTFGTPITTHPMDTE